jgi:catechol 1,2-dioxygenase
MSIRTPDDLTNAVVKVMAQTNDDRLREIMISLVNHLHGLIQDVSLTEEEFRAAAAVLARLGQQTTDTHNEVILMAGSLGVSSLVCLLNNRGSGGSGGSNNHSDTKQDFETTHNLLGPFWRMNSPAVANGGSLVRGPTEGIPLHVDATVHDTDGNPIAGAVVDVWHCAPTGFYENQLEARSGNHGTPQVDMNLRGKFITDKDGKFNFWSVKPVGYPIPTDGVVGQLLASQNRHPMRPAHLHALAFKEGFKTLISQVYADDDPNLATDVQFGVTEALTGRFSPHTTPPRDRPTLAGEWCSLNFTFKMQRGVALLPRPPIK